MTARLAAALCLAAAGASAEVWKGAELRQPSTGPGYTIAKERLAKIQRSQGEPVDQVLWIRRGTGKLGVGSSNATIGAGDLVRLPRAAAYSIEPAQGGLEFVSVRIKPLAPGRGAPAGIRPARGEMPYVVKKAEIDRVIATVEANAPLHSQDNFTVNYVLFKGRVGPWEAHAGCADIYLVQTGSGVIQLGGAIENAREESPGEPRGTAMKGSAESAVAGGDLVAIPRHTAHHMNPKTLPLAYVLIKVWSE